MNGQARRRRTAGLTGWAAAALAPLLILAAPAAAGDGKQVFQETAIAVSGMFCSSCAAAVEKALKSLNGVTEARADVKSDQVRVRYDGKKVTPRQMVETIRKAGYQARRDGEPPLR